MQTTTLRQGISCLSAALVMASLSLPACTSGGEGMLVPATVADDATLPREELGDGTLVHLRTLGDPASPTVIVLHGGPGGDHRDYLALAEALAGEFHVVLWDQRGTGLSERVPDEELDGPTYLADLDFLGERFSPGRPFHLIGHSWGGAYATYYLQSFPDRVGRAVLAEPGALSPEAAREANVAPVDFGDAELHEMLNTTDYILPDTDARADYFYVIALAAFKEDERLLGYDFWRLGYRANIGINTWQGNFDRSFTFDFTTGLDAFEGEVLFITGAADGRLGHDFQAKYQIP
ncbi:MAG: alpha/beta hydrolase, partial [Polyangiaceae bacterium]